MKTRFAANPLAMAVVTALAAQSTWAQEDPAAGSLEVVTVVGKSVSYANNDVSTEMIEQQSTITSVLAVIDNLPGVLINEGDTFGSDDWSTTVSIRGFQLSLDEQQIGTTADGIPNGNSNYGGGAKANRYIDTENLLGATVSQGTADIASRSHEALGGTINFTTIDPGEEEKLVISYTTGDFDAQKYYARYETGELLNNTYAWISASSSENSDWVDQVAENTRDHLAVKFISEINGIGLTGYLSYDDVHEDNYQRVSLDQFNENPEWDRLNGDWTGIPYVDQVYRRGWSTLRENLLGYLKADFSLAGVDVSSNVYFHENEGRGDWLPPYLLNNDGSITSFVDANGQPLTPNAGCVSSITFPYGGSGPESDPACYASNAIPVGSYRHTHYEKERFGFNVDFAWTVDLNGLENTLRGGLWFEDYERDEYRDWHQVIDSRSSFRFDHQAYLTQYDRAFPVETLMYYLEDTLTIGPADIRLGVKEFDVELDREDHLTASPEVTINSDSDTLVSGGVVFRLPVDGLEFFTGYAENFAAIKDSVLESGESAIEDIEPELAENTDIGLRYTGPNLSASITFYEIEFDNRLTFLQTSDPTLGPQYSIEDGRYLNVGGIDSSGVEIAATLRINDYWSAYFSYTDNESEYVGTGDEDLDDLIGITPGNTVFGAVEDMYVISLDWQKEKYFAGISTKYVGDRWMNFDNTQKIDAYTVTDVYAGVTLQFSGDIKELNIRATVNNITDEDYLAGVAGQAAWIGAPRTAAINFSATF